MTLTPGTSLWAIQQMLDGKKVRHKSWGPEEYIYIEEDVILSEEGDVQSLTHSMFNYTGWLLWTPHNPHTKGTFAWAIEETKQGNQVELDCVLNKKDSNGQYVFTVTWKLVDS